jgi:hypothetical protein
MREEDHRAADRAALSCSGDPRAHAGHIASAQVGTLKCFRGGFADRTKCGLVSNAQRIRRAAAAFPDNRSICIEQNTICLRAAAVDSYRVAHSAPLFMPLVPSISQKPRCINELS